MTLKTPAELRADAERHVSAVQGARAVTPADRAAIVDAVTRNLATADQTRMLDNQLLKIDAQLQTLSFSVATITDAAARIGRAARALERHSHQAYGF